MPTPTTLRVRFATVDASVPLVLAGISWVSVRAQLVGMTSTGAGRAGGSDRRVGEGVNVARALRQACGHGLSRQLMGGVRARACWACWAHRSPRHQIFARLALFLRVCPSHPGYPIVTRGQHAKLLSVPSQAAWFGARGSRRPSHPRKRAANARVVEASAAPEAGGPTDTPPPPPPRLASGVAAKPWRP